MWIMWRLVWLGGGGFIVVFYVNLKIITVISITKNVTFKYLLIIVSPATITINPFHFHLPTL